MADQPNDYVKVQLPESGHDGGPTGQGIATVSVQQTISRMTVEQWLTIPDSIDGIKLSFDDKLWLVAYTIEPKSEQLKLRPQGAEQGINYYLDSDGYLIRERRTPGGSLETGVVRQSEIASIQADKQVMINTLPENFIVTPSNVHLHLDNPMVKWALDSIPDIIDGHRLSVVEKTELLHNKETEFLSREYRIELDRFIVRKSMLDHDHPPTGPVTYSEVAFDVPGITPDGSVAVIPLTDRQREQFGRYIDGIEFTDMPNVQFPEIHQVQILSVPDRIGDHYFDHTRKIDLLTAAARFDRLGVSYYLNGQHEIVRLAIHEDTSHTIENVTRKEITFNIPLLNNTIMNEQNVNYLKLQLKYLGFGEVLNEQLEAAIKNPEIGDFSMKAQSNKPTKMGNTSQFELFFNQNSDTGNYYFPRYRTDLLDRDGNVSRSNYFGVYQTKSVRAMESVNMLEGRSVKTLRKEGSEEAVVYAKLDFNKRTQHGNYKTDFTNAERYGIDVMAIVDKSHVILENEEQKQRLAKSVEKGNLVEARFWYNGKIEEGFVSLNTQYKNFDYYERDLKPAYSKLVGEQVERENRNTVDIAPEDELEMRNVEIVSPSETDRLLKTVMGRDGSQDHLAVRLADLTDKQIGKVLEHFQEGKGNPPVLSKKQLDSVPDIVDGNKLSENMKLQLLYGQEVTVQPNLVYQAATDRSIERIIQSGEVDRINRSKVLPEDVAFSNNQSADLKPWENGEAEELGEKAGISR